MFTVTSSKTIAALTQQAAQLADVVSALKQQIDSVEQQIESVVNAKVEQRIATIEQERQTRLESKNPYFEIITEVDLDDDSKTKFELDWNPAFITELKGKGYTGRTDQEYVYKWIRTIADQVEQTMDENAR